MIPQIPAIARESSRRDTIYNECALQPFLKTSNTITTMSRFLFLSGAVFFLLSTINADQHLRAQEAASPAETLSVNRELHAKPYLAGLPFRSITLEMSLKPFKNKEPEAIRAVCREVFTQWASLLRHADTVSILLWTADGSEILDYSGDLAQRLEWGQYIGNPNSGRPVNSGPKNLTTHERAFDYMEQPPVFTYGDLKFIVQTLKEEGTRLTGKPVRIGETFDPGPEFAKSPFKYEKHPEICMAKTMGAKTFVCCYALLNKDEGKYAGFPDGIPQDTPFGTFLGRQSQHFLADLGFDYLWLSNGLGFGLETWATTGAVFDGKEFHRENIFETRKKIIEFWKLFRKECPDFRVETRGTNLSTGIDLASDGVDLRGIYHGDFNILPPPNSPWAALNGDFGIELVGYMSRLVETPDDQLLFRYYTHDPWWANSPWLDRYGREPHDISLPMAVARVNGEGRIDLPTHLNLLSIDDSFGNMPSQVPDEVTPHLLAARYAAPDRPGPTVWVYPFDEYHDWADTQPERLEEIFFGDWFIRQAINEGFPLNTVVSTKVLTASLEKNPRLYDQSVLVTTVPTPDSVTEKALMDFVERGGKLLVYGPAIHAGEKFRDWLGVAVTEPLDGEFELSTTLHADLVQKQGPMKIVHRSLFCGGGVESIVKNPPPPGTGVLASMRQKDQARDVVIARADVAWNGGKVVYVRGTNSALFRGGHLLRADNPEQAFIGGRLMRLAMQEFGYLFQQEKRSPAVASPVICISRNENAFYFSTCVPDTTLTQRFRFPQGAPLLLGYETFLEGGCSSYRLPRAEHRECCVFVRQPESAGTVYCKERTTEEIEITRRLEIGGLENATVTVYPPERITEQTLNAYNNADRPWRTGRVPVKKGPPEFGHCFVVENVSGKLVLSW